MLSGRTTLVGLIGNPVEHSLSPAMHNAAFAARGLDWASAAPVDEGRVEDAVRGLVALGFAGANVTAPHKAAAAAACETELDSVNVLVVGDGRVQGLSTDAAILDGLPSQQPVILGNGRAAAAFRAALPAARVFSRRGDWPPDVAGADLVVNATSERAVVPLRPVRGSDPGRPAVSGDGDRGGGARGGRDRGRRPRRAGRARRCLVRALDRRARTRRGDARPRTSRDELEGQ